MEQMESILGQGLDRTVNAVIVWVKLYLQNEQKKPDYQPDTDVDTISSAACLRVVQNLQPIIQQIKISYISRITVFYIYTFRFLIVRLLALLDDGDNWRSCSKF